MEKSQGKTNWTKIAMGAGLTFGVVIAAMLAYDLAIKPILDGTKEEQSKSKG